MNNSILIIYSEKFLKKLEEVSVISSVANRLRIFLGAYFDNADQFYVGSSIAVEIIEFMARTVLQSLGPSDNKRLLLSRTAVGARNFAINRMKRFSLPPTREAQ